MSALPRRYIDFDLLVRFESASFTRNEPFPWFCLGHFLTPDGFARLADDFPALELFEWHVDLPRAHGQRPHNRYYLAYEDSIYHGGHGASGTVRHQDLSSSWQRFLEELQGDAYLDFARRLLGVRDFQVRFAWHVGVTGSEVSPHRDDRHKIGTQIFYFNRDGDWDPAWGGETLLLDGKRIKAFNPEIEEFERIIPVGPPTANQSFMFKNTANAWHGVRALTCPEGAQRRLFNVIIERRGVRGRFRGPLRLMRRLGDLLAAEAPGRR